MSHSKGAKLRAGVTLQAGTWVGVQTGSWTRLQVGGVAVAAQAWGVQSGPQVPSGHPPVLRPQTQMQQIMAHCFLAVKSKLECKLGYFDLIGCDFLIDENFKVLLWCARVGGPGQQVQGGGDFCAHPDPSGVSRGWGEAQQQHHPKLCR